MSWGINETAPEIEKIKSESADYLNGLNSCRVIDWDTYSYAFDFYEDLLIKAYEQGKKDAQPELCEDAVSRKAAIDSACKNSSAKRLNDLIFGINPDEICEQMKSGNLKNWCVTMQTEMGMALIQLLCWAEGESE